MPMARERVAMGKLREILDVEPTKTKVREACVRLIDSEVSAKRGMMAIPLKAGFKVVKGFRPGFVSSVVGWLLPQFCDALEPFYIKWSETPEANRGSLDAELRREENRVSEALLGVTDARVDRSSNRVIVKVYRKLRGKAKGHVVTAIPGLGRAIEPFLTA